MRRGQPKNHLADLLEDVFLREVRAEHLIEFVDAGQGLSFLSQDLDIIKHRLCILLRRGYRRAVHLRDRSREFTRRTHQNSIADLMTFILDCRGGRRIFELKLVLAYRKRVAVAQDVLLHANSAEEGSISAVQVNKQVRLADSFYHRVFARYLSVVEHDIVSVAGATDARLVVDEISLRRST